MATIMINLHAWGRVLGSGRQSVSSDKPGQFVSLPCSERDTPRRVGVTQHVQLWQSFLQQMVEAVLRCAAAGQHEVVETGNDIWLTGVDIVSHEPAGRDAQHPL